MGETKFSIFLQFKTFNAPIDAKESTSFYAKIQFYNSSFSFVKIIFHFIQFCRIVFFFLQTASWAMVNFIVRNFLLKGQSHWGEVNVLLIKIIKFFHQCYEFIFTLMHYLCILISQWQVARVKNSNK